MHCSRLAVLQYIYLLVIALVFNFKVMYLLVLKVHTHDLTQGFNRLDNVM